MRTTSDLGVVLSRTSTASSRCYVGADAALTGCRTEVTLEVKSQRRCSGRRRTSVEIKLLAARDRGPLRPYAIDAYLDGPRRLHDSTKPRLARP